MGGIFQARAMAGSLLTTSPMVSKFGLNITQVIFTWGNNYPVPFGIVHPW